MRLMKFKLAATALPFLTLVLVLAAPGSPQAQEGSGTQGRPSQALPGPGEGLPPGIFNGLELQHNEPYQAEQPFCGDDIVSRIICRPAAHYTSQTAAAMCQSFYDGNLPNLQLSVGTELVNVSVIDMKTYCSHFFPQQGISCRTNYGQCALQAPAPVDSDCQCNTVQFGAISGKVVNK
jgi:hypothetical protein